MQVFRRDPFKVNQIQKKKRSNSIVQALFSLWWNLNFTAALYSSILLNFRPLNNLVRDLARSKIILHTKLRKKSNDKSTFITDFLKFVSVIFYNNKCSTNKPVVTVQLWLAIMYIMPQNFPFGELVLSGKDCRATLPLSIFLLHCLSQIWATRMISKTEPTHSPNLLSYFKKAEKFQRFKAPQIVQVPPVPPFSTEMYFFLCETEICVVGWSMYISMSMSLREYWAFSRSLV